MYAKKIDKTEGETKDQILFKELIRKRFQDLNLNNPRHDLGGFSEYDDEEMEDAENVDPNAGRKQIKEVLLDSGHTSQEKDILEKIGGKCEFSFNDGNFPSVTDMGPPKQVEPKEEVGNEVEVISENSRDKEIQ